MRWTPVALTAIALGAFLVAPNVDGPLLVTVWLLVIGGVRAIAALLPDPRSRAVLDIAFIVGCVAAAFEGGWLLIPAAVAWLALDLRAPGLEGADQRR
jgi:hypothetical protein